MRRRGFIASLAGLFGGAAASGVDDRPSETAGSLREPWMLDLPGAGGPQCAACLMTSQVECRDGWVQIIEYHSSECPRARHDGEARKLYKPEAVPTFKGEPISYRGRLDR